MLNMFISRCTEVFVLGCLASCAKSMILRMTVMFWVVVFLWGTWMLSSLACWWPLTPQHIVGRGLREGGELQLRV